MNIAAAGLCGRPLRVPPPGAPPMPRTLLAFVTALLTTLA